MATNHAFTRFWQLRGVRRVRYGASPVRWLRYLSAGKRQLPGFIIAGAQKAGTTSLHGYLLGHPCVGASLHKEVHYFDKNYQRGIDWYRMHFPKGCDDHASHPGASTVTMCCESSPYYMCHPLVPGRIRQVLPECKIILLLRHPVDRAYSHYQHNVRRVRETLSFAEAVAAEPERLRGEYQRLIDEPHYLSFAHQKYSYLSRGAYADQLALWREHFPTEQLLLIESGELFKQPGSVLRRTLEFLGLPGWEPSQYENLNVGRYKEPMDPGLRQQMLAYFAPHNERLYAMLGQRFDWDR